MSDRPPPPDDSADRQTTDPSPSFVAKLQRFLMARGELLGLEAKEASSTLIRHLVLLLAAIGAVLLAYLFLIAAAAWILHHFLSASPLGNWSIPLTALIFAVLHLATAFLLSTYAKKKSGPPLFEFTRNEWKKDCAWLQKKTSKNENEN